MKKNNLLLYAIGLGLLYVFTKKKKTTTTNSTAADAIGPAQGGGTATGPGATTAPISFDSPVFSASTSPVNNAVNNLEANVQSFNY